MASNPIPISEWDFFNMIMNVVTHDIIVVEVTVAEKTLNYDEILRAHVWLYYLVRDFYKNIAETFSKKANVEVDLFEAENSLEECSSNLACCTKLIEVCNEEKQEDHHAIEAFFALIEKKLDRACRYLINAAADIIETAGFETDLELKVESFSLEDLAEHGFKLVLGRDTNWMPPYERLYFRHKLDSVLKMLP